MSLRFVARYATAGQFLASFDGEVKSGGLLVRGAKVAGAGAGDECTVAVQIGDDERAEVAGHLAAVASIGVAVTFDGVPAALEALARSLRGGEELVAEAAEEEAPAAGEEGGAAPAGTAADRIAGLTVGQQMSLAMSGDRLERFALFRHTNKSLHTYVLRNPRIQLDEVTAAAKMTTLSPDALKAIGDHKDFSANVTIATALVRNPKTPMPTALKLLPKLPPNEIRAIAKGGAREPLMQAARKILGGGK